jgi:uncharacterized MAPEG superfamily protein
MAIYQSILDGYWIGGFSACSTRGYSVDVGPGADSARGYGLTGRALELAQKFFRKHPFFLAQDPCAKAAWRMAKGGQFQANRAREAAARFRVSTSRNWGSHLVLSEKR